jgi:predicted acyl esterase
MVKSFPSLRFCSVSFVAALALITLTGGQRVLAQDAAAIQNPKSKIQNPATVVLNELVMVPARDGVRLATFIRRPETNQKVPAILSRTPYNAAPKVELPPRE